MRSADQSAYWLSFVGPSGTGKTMLARKCASFMRKYLDGYDDEVRTMHGPGGSLVTKVLRRGGFKDWATVLGDMLGGDYTGLRDMADDWFVALDDIGAEYAGTRELSVAKLYDLLNRRAGRFTVITANLDLQAISKKLDARIASRLIRDGSVVIDVKAIDYNLR